MTSITNAHAVLDDLIEYEAGNLDATQTVEFFAGLIKSGMAYQLQGSYGRAADFFVTHGIISPEGEILKRPDED